MDPATTGQISTLEHSLWIGETRYSYAHMQAILAEDFIELGHSGKRYTRSDILADTGNGGDIPARQPLRDFEVHSLSAHIIQTLYISELSLPAGLQRSNRSSLWRREGQVWKICFHQGSACS